MVTERDGKTVKAPGVSETVRRREELRYAADGIDQVWTAIEWLRIDPECDLMAVYEEHPAITVLGGSHDIQERKEEKWKR